MVAYRFLAVDPLTFAVRDEIPFESVKFETVLSGAGSFSASLPANHPKCRRATLDPARTLIYVERDGLLIWAGWLWSAKVGEQVQFDGGELWSYWRRRLIRQSVVHSTVDTATIAERTISVGQAAVGSFTFHQLAIGKTGTTADLTVQGYERKTVAQVVEDLAGRSVSGGGFEFGTTHEWSGNSPQSTFHVWAPTRGRDLEFLFDDQGTAESVDWTVDGTACANRVDVCGNGQADGMTIGTANDTDLLATYPLLEHVESGSDTNGLLRLTSRASALLAARRLPAEVVDVTAGRNPAVTYGTYGLGDTITVRATNPYATIDGRYRCVSIGVSVAAGGDEQVVPTFAEEGTFG